MSSWLIMLAVLLHPKQVVDDFDKIGRLREADR